MRKEMEWPKGCDTMSLEDGVWPIRSGCCSSSVIRNRVIEQPRAGERKDGSPGEVSRLEVLIDQCGWRRSVEKGR